MPCSSKFSVTNAGSGDYYSTFNQRTDWSASVTGSQREERYDSPPYSERRIKPNEGKIGGQKGQRPPQCVAVACEALYRGLRELPLQVGPGWPGGTAFCTRSWQILACSIVAALPRSSDRAIPKLNIY